MKDLQALCSDLGLENVRTYIQSGNVLFDSKRPEAALRRMIEAAITNKLGRPVQVLIRTAAELKAIIEENPFPDAQPEQVGVEPAPDAGLLPGPEPAMGGAAGAAQLLGHVLPSGAGGQD